VEQLPQLEVLYFRLTLLILGIWKNCALSSLTLRYVTYDLPTKTFAMALLYQVQKILAIAYLIGVTMGVRFDLILM